VFVLKVVQGEITVTYQPCTFIWTRLSVGSNCLARMLQMMGTSNIKTERSLCMFVIRWGSRCIYGFHCTYSTGSKPVTIPMSLSGSEFRKLRKGTVSMRY
jgi:hypothetical protein